mgnify:CR=1 FL=1
MDDGSGAQDVQARMRQADLMLLVLQMVERGEMTVQELFLGGKLKMEGDYSLALQISMQLLTNPL